MPHPSLEESRRLIRQIADLDEAIRAELRQSKSTRDPSRVDHLRARRKLLKQELERLGDEAATVLRRHRHKLAVQEERRDLSRKLGPAPLRKIDSEIPVEEEQKRLERRLGLVAGEEEE